MLYNEILAELQNDYDKRVTQIEMAKKYKVTQNTIQRLLADKKNILGIKLETLQKMFPNATIYGKSNHISNSQITNNQGLINSSNNNFLSLDKSKIINNLLMQMLNSQDFTDTEKVKFMQFLQKELN
jgi:transcriptional regulator with XRE-family HTH domain